MSDSKSQKFFVELLEPDSTSSSSLTECCEFIKKTEEDIERSIGEAEVERREEISFEQTYHCGSVGHNSEIDAATTISVNDVNRSEEQKNFTITIPTAPSITTTEAPEEEGVIPATATPTIIISPASTPSGHPRTGLEGVPVTPTRLSMVDGKNGVLLIGGYQVEQIADRVSLEEVAMLLWSMASMTNNRSSNDNSLSSISINGVGDLPTASTLRAMRKELVGYRFLSPATLAIIRAAAAVNAPPIDALRMACATLSLEVVDPNDISPASELAMAKRLLSCFPTVVAAHSRLRRGLEPIEPNPSLSLAANFLYMNFGVEPDARMAKALETYWVTVCDHGLNASTFAARVIASTRTDMISAITGAIGALKGPLHGGAPGPVLDMLVEVKNAGGAGKAEAWIRKEIGEGRRIMGFGHRIYKVRDPRAEVLSRVADELGKGGNPETAELCDLARAMEKTAVRVLEELKPGRNLKTNVEFYTALVLHSIGLQADQFVAMFACGRVVGWCSHVIEQHRLDHLLRPTSVYIGPRRTLNEQKDEREEDEGEKKT